MDDSLGSQKEREEKRLSHHKQQLFVDIIQREEGEIMVKGKVTKTKVPGVIHYEGPFERGGFYRLGVPQDKYDLIGVLRQGKKQGGLSNFKQLMKKLFG